LAEALASYYRQLYASPLALLARAAAGLAEQMYGQYGDEAAGCGIWRGSWELLSGLPAAVAAAGSLREVGTWEVDKIKVLVGVRAACRKYKLW
jgi:hypothetical protein